MPGRKIPPRNVCPARTILDQQSYGDEMSASDPIHWQTILRFFPHEPGRELIGGLIVCKHCASVYYTAHLEPDVEPTRQKT